MSQVQSLDIDTQIIEQVSSCIQNTHNIDAINIAKIISGYNNSHYISTCLSHGPILKFNYHVTEHIANDDGSVDDGSEQEDTSNSIYLSSINDEFVELIKKEDVFEFQNTFFDKCSCSSSGDFTQTTLQTYPQTIYLCSGIQKVWIHKDDVQNLPAKMKFCHNHFRNHPIFNEKYKEDVKNDLVLITLKRYDTYDVKKIVNISHFKYKLNLIRRWYDSFKPEDMGETFAYKHKMAQIFVGNDENEYMTFHCFSDVDMLLNIYLDTLKEHKRMFELSS